MKVTVDTKRVMSFIRRHREALVVFGVFTFVNHKQAKRILAMQKFIDLNGMHDAFCRSQQ